jgi:hypothetical protein
VLKFIKHKITKYIKATDFGLKQPEKRKIPDSKDKTREIE